MNAPLRIGAHVLIVDGHTHAGQGATITGAVGTAGYIVRIGDDITRIAPQYVRADQIQTAGGTP
jgi:hypothetical protein